MRAVKVLGSIIFGVIIIITIVGYFAVRNFDLNKYKPYIEQAVEDAIHRNLVIRGEAKVGVSLVPTIIINDVELSNAEWAVYPEMVKVQQAEVKFALLPLLKKQIVIEKVSLISPEIYLETDKNGANNWSFGQTTSSSVEKVSSEGTVGSVKAAAQTSSAAAMAGFAAKNVQVKDGVVVYYEGASQKETKLNINEITMSAPAMDQDMKMSFDMMLDNKQIEGKVNLGSLQTLLDNREPYPFNLTAEALNVKLKVEGSAADVMSSPKYAVQGNIYNPAGNFDAPETTLEFVADGDLNSVDVNIKTLNVVNNVIAGTLRADWSKKIPFVKVDLNSEKINLQNFNKNTTLGFVFPSLISAAYAEEMIPDTVIPYELLNMVNAQANVKVQELIVDKSLSIQNVVMVADLQNGVLNVRPLEMNFGGGKIDATATVDAASQKITLDVKSSNLQLKDMHEEFKVLSDGDFGVLNGGNIDVNINLSGQGATSRQLVKNLKGSVIGIVGESVLQTGGLQFMTGNFVTQLLSAVGIDTSKSDKLNVECAVVRSDIADGKVVFPKGIALKSKQLSVVSDGNVNLLNDKIDFSVRPSSNKVANANVVQALSSFIKVQGTIQSPKLTLDDKEALKTLVGVATTGGAAYIGSKMVLDTDSSPCYTALRGTAFEGRFPKPTGIQATTQEVYQDAGKQVKQELKNLKNTAKDFLKTLKTDIKK